MTASYDIDTATDGAKDGNIASQISVEALKAISDAAIHIADGRGTSRSTIGWNKQRALAEKVLSQIYLAGMHDASRS
ncbi:hypothetical protein [Pseudochelatococcus sp. G4_1912]|uniref:hypothetical protein n=1 Tax=Pseudochelatococcus sp. G4_1912 TaxID=3114288 RepID=UPI0039C63776